MQCCTAQQCIQSLCLLSVSEVASNSGNFRASFVFHRCCMSSSRAACQQNTAVNAALKLCQYSEGLPARSIRCRQPWVLMPVTLLSPSTMIVSTLCERLLRSFILVSATDRLRCPISITFSTSCVQATFTCSLLTVFTQQSWLAFPHASH